MSHSTRRGLTVLAGIIAALLPSCSPRSTARSRIATVRPTVDLSNVRAVAWPGTEAALVCNDPSRFEQDLALVVQMTDDLAISHGDAMLWVSDWSTDELAQQARERLQRVLQVGTDNGPQLTRTGRRLFARWATLPAGVRPPFLD